MIVPFDVFVASVALGLLSASSVQSSAPPEKMNETRLRSRVISSVRPPFPEQIAKGKRTGVAVAEVSINPQGVVDQVTVLQSPDETISRSVETAVKQWRFAVPISNRVVAGARGKLTFYFVNDEIQRCWRVLYPDEFPGDPIR